MYLLICSLSLVSLRPNGLLDILYATIRSLVNHLVALYDIIFGMSRISTRLKELREEKGLSARELARALNVSDRAIQRWEKEERIPNADAVVIIAKFFDVSTDYLLGIED